MRPFPLHLMAPLLAWAQACALLTAWNSSAAGEAFRQGQSLLTGLNLYCQHPYRRSLSEPPVAWAEGASRLLDYGPSGGRPVLFVPSLINPSYVFDLSLRRSLLRWLSVRGIRPFLLDWGHLLPIERHFTLDDYVERICRAIGYLRTVTGGPISVVGHCMGGTLAVASISFCAPDVRSFAALATPWDFHADIGARQRMAPLIPLLMSFIEAVGEWPLSSIRALFTSAAPLHLGQKFTRFSALEMASEEAEDFVALEDWVNDGGSLPAGVGKQCLRDWYGCNDPAQGRWSVHGKRLHLHHWAIPALCVVPTRDRIVSPLSSSVLADQVPGASRLDVDLGHVGLIVGKKALSEVWSPLLDWLHRI